MEMPVVVREGAVGIVEVLRGLLQRAFGVVFLHGDRDAVQVEGEEGVPVCPGQVAVPSRDVVSEYPASPSRQGFLDFGVIDAVVSCFEEGRAVVDGAGIGEVVLEPGIIDFLSGSAGIIDGNAGFQVLVEGGVADAAGRLFRGDVFQADAPVRFAAVALFPFDAVQFVCQSDFPAVGEGDAFHEVALRAF